MPRNKTKQARSSSLLLLSIGAAFFTFASKTSIVSIYYAKVNSSNLSGLEHSLCSYTHERHQEKGWDTQGRERVFFFPPVQMRACPHCTEKSGRQLDRFCSKVAGMCEGAAYGKVVPSRLLHKFGKLTQKIEMLCKKPKARSFNTLVGRRAGVGAGGAR